MSITRRDWNGECELATSSGYKPCVPPTMESDLISARHFSVFLVISSSVMSSLEPRSLLSVSWRLLLHSR